MSRQASTQHASELRHLFATTALDEAILQMSDMRLRFDLADASRWPGGDDLVTPRSSGGTSFRNGYTLAGHYKKMYEANVGSKAEAGAGAGEIKVGGEARLL